jgi:hypothetical protein
MRFTVVLEFAGSCEAWLKACRFGDLLKEQHGLGFCFGEEVIKGRAQGMGARYGFALDLW